MTTYSDKRFNTVIQESKEEIIIRINAEFDKLIGNCLTSGQPVLLSITLCCSSDNGNEEEDIVKK